MGYVLTPIDKATLLVAKRGENVLYSQKVCILPGLALIVIGLDELLSTWEELGLPG